MSEENAETVLVPADEPQDDAPELSVVPKVVTRTAAKRALKKLGKSNFNLGNIEAKSTFGQYVGALGIGNQAAADYVETIHDLTTAIEATVALDAQLTDPNAKERLMQTREKLLKQRVLLIEVGFKAGAFEKQSQATNNPNHIPFPANTMISVNIGEKPETIEVKS